MSWVKRIRCRSVRTAVALGIVTALGVVGISYAMHVRLPHDETLDPSEKPSIDVSDHDASRSVDAKTGDANTDTVDLFDEETGSPEAQSEGDTAPAEQPQGSDTDANTDPNPIDKDWRLDPPESEFVTQ